MLDSILNKYYIYRVCKQTTLGLYTQSTKVVLVLFLIIIQIEGFAQDSDLEERIKMEVLEGTYKLHYGVEKLEDLIDL